MSAQCAVRRYLACTAIYIYRYSVASNERTYAPTLYMFRYFFSVTYPGCIGFDIAGLISDASLPTVPRSHITKFRIVCVVLVDTLLLPFRSWCSWLDHFELGMDVSCIHVTLQLTIGMLALVPVAIPSAIFFFKCVNRCHVHAFR